MILKQLKTDLETFRSYGESAQLETKLLAILVGSIENHGRRHGGTVNDDEANKIISRSLRHAGITLQMNPGDPTASAVIKLYSKYHVEAVMGDDEMRERILASQLSTPKDVLKYLNNFGPAVDMTKARAVVKTLFGQ